MALRIMEVKKLEEKWKTVKGYEDYYEVSNHGNVRNKRTKHLRKLQNKGFSNAEKTAVSALIVFVTVWLCMVVWVIVKEL